jgi:hypothetical protein
MRCKICGDIAKCSNYGVITCMSCKVFFQRHGLKNTNTFVRGENFHFDYLFIENVLDNIEMSFY